MKRILQLLGCLTLSLSLWAQSPVSVKGTVTDPQTGQPLVGAAVEIKSGAYKAATTSGLDGSFILHHVPAATYELKVKYLAYESSTQQITVGEATTTVNVRLTPKNISLKEVAVGGKSDKSTDRSALKAVQKADVVLNAISAAAIQNSPDITIANVMQRMSGVSLERSNNGEGQYAIIRGMDKRYQYTLVNGIKIPSPDNKNRYVPLDIFPAEMVDRLEVYKGLTAKMEGDAIAGATNMVMKSAPEQFTLSANAAVGMAQTFSKNDFTGFDHGASKTSSPRVTNGDNYLAKAADLPYNTMHTSQRSNPASTIFGLSVGGRTKDKKLGAIAAASYQNSYRATQSVLYDTKVNTTTNEPDFSDIERRSYSIQQQRLGVTGKVDYRFNDDQQISLFGMYAMLNQNSYRYSSDTDLVLGRTVPGSGRVTNEYRSERTQQKIANFTLQGDHKLARHLHLDWSGVYSKATSATPQRTTLNTFTGNNPQKDGTLLQADTLIDPLKGAEMEWFHNTDEDKAGYLNLTFTPTIANTKFEISAGGMYRDKSRTAAYDTYTLRPDSSTQAYHNDIDKHGLTVFNPQGSAGNALNYRFSEKTAAYYGQVKFDIGHLQTLAGLRLEQTHESWNSALDATANGKIGNIKYYDLLPSVHFKYQLAHQQDIRLSYYSAISRPGFYETVPHESNLGSEDYPEIGNPNLKRTTSSNFDLRYEFFPKAFDQLLVGVFYKDIRNPIEMSLTEINKEIVYQANNFGAAHNYGFEIDATKYIRKFGIRANYTFTSSNINSTKSVYVRDSTGNVAPQPVGQNRPLQGQSKHIANLSLLYKDAHSGFDAQVALAYVGDRIDHVSPYLNNDTWQKGFVQLDISVQKKIYKHLFLYAKANNLLNTPYELEIHRNTNAATGQLEYQSPGKNAFVRKDTYGQNYLLGLRFKM